MYKHEKVLARHVNLTVSALQRVSCLVETMLEDAALVALLEDRNALEWMVPELRQFDRALRCELENVPGRRGALRDRLVGVGAKSVFYLERFRPASEVSLKLRDLCAALCFLELQTETLEAVASDVEAHTLEKVASRFLCPLREYDRSLRALIRPALRRSLVGAAIVPPALAPRGGANEA